MADPLSIVLQRMKARNNSEQTVDRFKLYVLKFLEYLKQKNIKFKDADCDTFMSFLSESDSCGNTKATMFYAMRTIYQIWGKKWTLEKSDVPKKSTPNRPWYTESEIDKIVKTADMLDYASASLVRISRDCGCRRAAIQKILRTDFIDGETPRLKIHAVKHGRPIEMFIAKDTAQAIKNLISHRKDKSPYLFVNEKGEQIGLVRLSNIFTHVAKLAGVYKKSAGIHACRRSKVTRLRKAGLDEFDIIESLGWRPGSPMVHVYCMLDNEEIQEKAAKADPLMKNGE